MKKQVRVRFAPSPTGFLHIGGLRTALYNECVARQHGGDFILRIEDTDRARSVPGSVEAICRALKGVEIIPDEGVWLNDTGDIIERGGHGPYLQSRRKERHQQYARMLVDMDKAYYCFCSEQRLAELREKQRVSSQPTMYDGRCRSIPLPEADQRVAQGEAHVIRLKLPQAEQVTVFDVIRGNVTFDWSVIDDQVIIKSDGFPTYHLAATCDDHDMEITHVIRGEEWLSSAPKHIFIYDAFGWTPPQFAHLPLLFNADKSKLSKRQASVSVQDYLDTGYLPEALINFVALLGWNPSGDRELYSHEDLIKMFDLAKVNTSGAIFNIEKLKWMNHHYLQTMPEERYLTLTRFFVENVTSDLAFVDRCLLLVRDRVTFPQDVTELTAAFFKESLDYSTVSLFWKTQPKKEALERLSTIRDLLKSLPEGEFAPPSSVKRFEEMLKTFIQSRRWGNGDTLWPLRAALSGADKSPSPFELLYVYGKERSLKRLSDAITHLQEEKEISPKHDINVTSKVLR